MKDNMQRELKIPFDVNNNMIHSFRDTHKAIWLDNFTFHTTLQNVESYFDSVTLKDTRNNTYYMHLKHLIPLIPKFNVGKIESDFTFYRNRGYYYIKEYIQEPQLAPFDLWGGLVRHNDRWSVRYTRAELQLLGVNGFEKAEDRWNYVNPEMREVTTLTLDLKLKSIYGISSGFAVEWVNVDNEKQIFPMNSANYVAAIPYINCGKLSGTFTVTQHSGYYSIKLVI